jgi:N-acetylmuramoyl-L-alanine amidase
VSTLTNPATKASAHLVIGRSGDIHQLVPFNIIAWHAGASRHIETNRQGINKYSIGIELVNAGPLRKMNEVQYISWFGKIYPQEDVMEALHPNETEPRYWQRYSEEQLAACLEVSRLLAATYPITYILGHDEISPGRKIDPGPLFLMDRFRAKVLDLSRDDDEGDMEPKQDQMLYVNVDLLNVRKGPGIEFAKAGAALKLGTKVTVTQTQDKWCEVNLESTAKKVWVNGKYLSSFKP